MRPRLTSFRRRLARFGSAADGAAAVEFAMIALPFFALLFAIIEVAMVFILSTTLDSAMRTARTIRTGELQTGNLARTVPLTPTQLSADFKTAVCQNLGWLSNQCATNLYIDVRTFDMFNNVNAADPVTVNGSQRTFNQASLTFQPGGPEQIVLVRAFYRWRVFTPLLNPGLIELSDGSRLITSATVFRNEPYGQN